MNKKVFLDGRQCDVDDELLPILEDNLKRLHTDSPSQELKEITIAQTGEKYKIPPNLQPMNSDSGGDNRPASEWNLPQFRIAENQSFPPQCVS